MRAILSVSNKAGLVGFARQLEGLKFEIFSTGGTKKSMAEAGLKVRGISDITGFPEILDGRVKTLHPMVHGGILARRDLKEHMQELDSHKIGLIDLVVVNLYPFETVVSNPGTAIPEAVENIDIGGPSMVRSASKNFESVTVVVDPADYNDLMAEIEREGGVTGATRLRLAAKAFQRTAQYDGAIAKYLSDVKMDGSDMVRDGGPFPEFLPLFFHKAQDLRYGENPQQEAAFYRDGDRFLGALRQFQGKELSFNNILDLQGAWALACELPRHGCAIIKHTNPCGAGVARDAAAAVRRALLTDPTSAFGGIVAFNTPCDGEAAQVLADIFLEIVVAPAFEPKAMEIFGRKKNLRLIQLKDQDPYPGWDYKRVAGGLLVQTQDLRGLPEDRKVVTRRKPSAAEMAALELAWVVCKHVKSNAIVLCDAEGTVGVGAGQMSRVDSTKLARMKAFKDTKGTVAASDAFFPFADGVEQLAEAGVTAVIQPGGSIRDPEVIEAADKLKIAMVFSGARHFKHG
jgi:phosphoribosylaminoimidazolecarboxamide formyltransferase/IMP cyclohydrolase